MSSPKVSVIIPNYNHGAYLSQRIDSVIGQTFRDIEIIILDDFSSDNSREIINDYRQHPLVVKIIFNEQNTGNPFRQWLRGIEEAQGEWVWLAESDDYADERFLEILLSHVDKIENVGLIYCDSRIVNADNTIAGETFASIKNQRFGTDRWSMDYRNEGLLEIENYLLPGGTINNTSAVLFNRKILKTVNPFDIDFRYIGDKYAFVKVLAHADVQYVRESLNYYRNPFNSKHSDKYVFYFYEQFLVFDWVMKNLKITNRKKFYEGFYENTRNSIFRNWSSTKLMLYRKLLSVNPGLLLRSVSNNFMRGIQSIQQT